MNKFAMVLLLIVTLTGCGSDLRSSSYEPGTLTHNVEQIGLALNAEITIGEDVKIDAAITNVSGKTIVYNSRCGIPFGIYVKKADAYAYLVMHDEKDVSCNDLFDPNDLREMKPNDTFEKEMAFAREVYVTNDRTVRALSGRYEVSFSFQTHDHGSFFSSLPIELIVENKPEIMTVDQVKASAKDK